MIGNHFRQENHMLQDRLARLEAAMNVASGASDSGITQTRPMSLSQSELISGEVYRSNNPGKETKTAKNIQRINADEFRPSATNPPTVPEIDSIESMTSTAIKSGTVTPASLVCKLPARGIIIS